MSVLIGSWEFEGPFNELADLRSEPGIVAMLSRTNDELELIEIEESESVKDYLETKNPGFKRNAGDCGFATAVYYCADLNATLRQGLVDKLIQEFDCAD